MAEEITQAPEDISPAIFIDIPKSPYQRLCYFTYG
jgi:hypothetical protein